MRFPEYAIPFAMILILSTWAWQAAAQRLPACQTRVMTRQGDEITIGLQQLSNIFNQELNASHSHFSGLRLTAEGRNTIKVSGNNNGTPVSISGPLQAAGGAVKLHANQIAQNGTPEKGLMDLFGKDLASTAKIKDTPSLSARGNDILIHPDPLLHLAGPVTGVTLGRSSVTLRFASQPCR